MNNIYPGIKYIYRQLPNITDKDPHNISIYQYSNKLLRDKHQHRLSQKSLYLQKDMCHYRDHKLYKNQLNFCIPSIQENKSNTKFQDHFQRFLGHIHPDIYLHSIVLGGSMLNNSFDHHLYM